MRAWHLLGAFSLIDVLQRELGVPHGGTTSCGKFTLKHTSLFRSMRVAPRIMIAMMKCTQPSRPMIFPVILANTPGDIWGGGGTLVQFYRSHVLVCGGTPCGS